MKTSFLTLAVSALALIGFSPDVTAGPRFSFPSGFGQFPCAPSAPRFPSNHRTSDHSAYGVHRSHSYQGGHGSHSYQSSNTGHYSSHRSFSQCQTPYVVHTCEIARQRHCMTAIDFYGRPYPVQVTVVTYRAQYSNGTFRTYTQAFR